MKQKDLILIIVMVFISTVFSLLISRVVFSSPKNRQQSAEVVDLIAPEFLEPPAKYFNEKAVNPTQHSPEKPDSTDEQGTN